MYIVCVFVVYVVCVCGGVLCDVCMGVLYACGVCVCACEYVCMYV